MTQLAVYLEKGQNTLFIQVVEKVLDRGNINMGIFFSFKRNILCHRLLKVATETPGRQPRKYLPY